MMMYRCTDCFYEFDEPDMIRECIGEYQGQPAYEHTAVCPSCGSGSFEEVADDGD